MRRSASSARARAPMWPRRSSRRRRALGSRALARARSRPRWTPPGCSCCRRARRGWAACSSRRSAAAGASSGRVPARSPISSRTSVERAARRRRRRGSRSPTALVRVLSDRALAERLGEGARGRGGALAAVAGGVRTPDAGARRREVARLHHAVGGPGASGARRDRAEDPCARRAGRRGRRPRRHGRARGAPGELPRAQLRRVVAGPTRRARSSRRSRRSCSRVPSPWSRTWRPSTR